MRLGVEEWTPGEPQAAREFKEPTPSDETIDEVVIVDDEIMPTSAGTVHDKGNDKLVEYSCDLCPFKYKNLRALLPHRFWHDRWK